MFNELDTVVFAHNIDKHSLKTGDIGTIVHIYESHKAFEVEVVKADGKTIAVLTLTDKDITTLRTTN